MKRLISMLLAFALVMSLMPAMFASAEDVAEDKAYVFNTDYVDKTVEGVFDSTLTDGSLESSIVPVIGYGTHGFKYWTADKDTYNAASKSRALQLAGRFRMFPYYGSDDFTNNNGMRIALAFEKPSAVPSFYKIYMDTYSADEGYTDIWTRPLNEDNRDITYYQSSEAKNGDSYYTRTADNKSSRDYYYSELIYNNGTDDHVISFYTGKNEELNRGLQLELNSIKFMPVTATSVTLSVGSSASIPGETTQASVYATVDKTVWKVADSYVTYASSDESVAKIAPDGTITAIKEGTADISATIGETTYTFENYTVGSKAYDFKILPYKPSDIWDSTLTDGALQSSIVPIIDYGDHGYKYWTADEATYNAASTDRVLQVIGAGFRMFGNYGGALVKDKDDKAVGVRVALAFERPETAGFYRMHITRSPSGTKTTTAEVYATPIDEENKDITYYQSNASKIGTKWSFGDTTTKMSELIYNNGTDDHVFSFYSGYDEENGYGSNLQFAKIDLVPVAVDGLSLNVDASTLNIGDETKATVKAMNGEAEVLGVVDSYVTYESLNPTVAKVAEDGTVTALAAGEATIKATAGGLSATTTITVKPEATGEELSGTVTLGIFTNYTEAAAGVDAGAYNVNYVDGTTINIDTTVTAEANDIEGYRFAYWKDGSRFLSADNKITVTIARNTSLTAVYDVVSESAATKTVEFWNADKSFISSVTTEEDTVAALPENPEMTGMSFIGWYTDDETEFTKETVLTADVTRVVAKYETETTNYNVKVGEADNRGIYNAPVSLNAPATFTYWSLGGNKLSFKRSIEFFTYGDVEIKAASDEEAEAVPTVVIDKNLDAIFIAYDTPEGYERIETGIIFGASENIVVNACESKASAKNTAAFGQFTAKPMDDESYARGYQIFKKDGEIRVIYTAAIEVK